MFSGQKQQARVKATRDDASLFKGRRIAFSADLVSQASIEFLNYESRHVKDGLATVSFR
jgi:hypothetical protein